MQPIDDPFRTADWAVAKIHEETQVIFVDFHADATAEKMAMGWHLDGKVTAVIGTHTHYADGRRPDPPARHRVPDGRRDDRAVRFRPRA